MSDPSAKYGITSRTRKATTVACNDLSQAINSLNAHHTEEEAVFARNLEPVQAALDALADLPGGDADHQRIAKASEVIKGAAHRLRVERQRLLASLLDMLEHVVDVALDAESLLPENTMRQTFVEANPNSPAPTAILGDDLNSAERIRILDETYGWSRDSTLALCLAAVGPLYLLGRIIEFPTPEASKFREEARAAEKAVKTVAYKVPRL